MQNGGAYKVYKLPDSCHISRRHQDVTRRYLLRSCFFVTERVARQGARKKEKRLFFRTDTSGNVPMFQSSACTFTFIYVSFLYAQEVVLIFHTKV